MTFKTMKIASLTDARYVPNSSPTRAEKLREALSGLRGFDLGDQLIIEAFEPTTLPADLCVCDIEHGLAYVEPGIVFYSKHLRDEDGEDNASGSKYKAKPLPKSSR
ncbi:hypothetical protein C8Q76DRAFT_797955 [Earliella scabrosa]|nr:hypothetical protein C8Q76DRAFT_797955 [Earliella scabrosa]